MTFTFGVFPSMADTHELVVPRSIPMTWPDWFRIDSGIVITIISDSSALVDDTMKSRTFDSGCILSRRLWGVYGGGEESNDSRVCLGNGLWEGETLLRRANNLWNCPHFSCFCLLIYFIERRRDSTALRKSNVRMTMLEWYENRTDLFFGWRWKLFGNWVTNEYV